MKTFLPKRRYKLFFAFFFSFFLFTAKNYAQVGVNTSDPKSTFEVNGSMGQTVTTIAISTTLTDAHSIVVGKNGATPITITLPTAIGITGRIYTLKKDASSTTDITIATTASETIDGTSTLVLKNAGEVATLFSDGAGWKSLSKLSAASGAEWSLKGNANTTPGTDFIGTTDAKDLVVKTDGTSRINVGSDGVTKLGGVTNYTKIEADGTIEFNGTATVWDDMVVAPDATTRGGSKDPTYELFRKNGDGTSQGVMLNFFDKTAEEELYFTAQLPHRYKVGTALYPHIHWTTTAATPTGTNVVWGLEYTIVSFGNSYSTTTTLTTNSVISAITPSATHQHLISDFSPISGVGSGISTIIVCRLFRKAADTADTFDFDAALLSFDFHFEIDTEGSRTEFTK